MGPTLATLNGAAYNSTRALLLQALTKPALEQYKPAMLQILRNEHARWVARGGGLYLAPLTKQLVFKVYLAAVLGLPDDKAAGWHGVVEDFSHSGLCNSMSLIPDLGAVAIRDRVMKDLIRPALVASRTRTAQGSPKSCVLDSLVATKAFSDDEIRKHTLDLLVNAMRDLEGAAVSAITAMSAFPDAQHKLYDARDSYVRKYSDAADRWQHLDDDFEYLQRYLHEAVRYYYASSANQSGSAVQLASGELATVTSYNAAATKSLQFNPDRTDATTNELFPLAIDNALKTFVVQSAQATLLDFRWSTVPRQDFSWDTAAHQPKDGVLAVSFQRRTADLLAMDSPPTVEDWTLLRHPLATEYIHETESIVDMFSDKRLDAWTHAMLKFLQVKTAKWKTPHAETAITVPKYQKVLPKLTLHNTSIEISTDDEDWPQESILEVAAVTTLRDTMPFVDDFEHTWQPGEDREAYVLGKVGKMWPEVNVHWHDRYSDRALRYFVFAGLGQHLVQKLPSPLPDGSYYGVLLNSMAALDVRTGFAKYGADAYFDKQGNVVKIVRGGKTCFPGDVQWEAAKLAFRGSLSVHVHAVDHLVGLHTIVGNYLTTATREQLPPNHPLRRLIKPFTFRAVAIIRGASKSLFAAKGALHRTFALSETGMKQTWEAAQREFKFETFPDQMARQAVDTVTMPYHEDGLEFWTAVRSFVSNYIDLYFAKDDDLSQDKSVKAFWANLSTKIPGGLPPLSVRHLKDFVAQSIVWVTGMHNHLGSVSEYVSDPAFAPVAWVEGELAARPGSAVKTTVIVAVTGLSQPSILEDFSHVMLDDNAKAVCRAFTASLKEMAKAVDGRNAKRVQPYESFNPKTTDMSIGI